MKKGILASVLAVALLGGIAYADTSAGTHGARQMAAMHKMAATGQMMYDRDCPGLADSSSKRAGDRQLAGTVTEVKLNELQQEIMR